MSVVSMSYLLEAGVHFGHQTKRWNPKMKEYIFATRDDIYIIDLQKTAKLIEEAYNALFKIAEAGGKVLFVGTKKQAQDASREEAERSDSYYVTERWLGGTLTNFKTIRRRIGYMDEVEKKEQDGTFELLPKKEVLKIKKEYEKLDKYFSGLRNMKRTPQALVIVDPKKEYIAIREARALKIPVFGIVDTNCDPDLVDYVIPSNDDAIRAVKIVLGVLSNAICSATGREITDYLSDEDKALEPGQEIKKVEKVIAAETKIEEPKVEEKVSEVVAEEIKAEEPVVIKEKKVTKKAGEPKVEVKKEEKVKKVKEVAEVKPAKKTTKKVEKVVAETKPAKKAVKEVKKVVKVEKKETKKPVVKAKKVEPKKVETKAKTTKKK